MPGLCTIHQTNGFYQLLDHFVSWFDQLFYFGSISLSIGGASASIASLIYFTLFTITMIRFIKDEWPKITTIQDMISTTAFKLMGIAFILFFITLSGGTNLHQFQGTQSYDKGKSVLFSVAATEAGRKFFSVNVMQAASAALTAKLSAIAPAGIPHTPGANDFPVTNTQVVNFGFCEVLRPDLFSYDYALAADVASSKNNGWSWNPISDIANAGGKLVSAYVSTITGIFNVVLYLIPQVMILGALGFLLFELNVLTLNASLFGAIGIFTLGFLGLNETKQWGQAYFAYLYGLFVNSLVLTALIDILFMILRMGEYFALGMIIKAQDYTGTQSLAHGGGTQTLILPLIYILIGLLALLLVFSHKRLVAQIMSGSIAISGMDLLMAAGSAAAAVGGGAALLSKAISAMKAGKGANAISGGKKGGGDTKSPSPKLPGSGGGETPAGLLPGTGSSAPPPPGGGSEGATAPPHTPESAVFSSDAPPVGDAASGGAPPAGSPQIAAGTKADLAAAAAGLAAGQSGSAATLAARAGNAAREAAKNGDSAGAARLGALAATAQAVAKEPTSSATDALAAAAGGVLRGDSAGTEAAYGTLAGSGHRAAGAATAAANIERASPSPGGDLAVSSVAAGGGAALGAAAAAMRTPRAADRALHEAARANAAGNAPLASAGRMAAAAAISAAHPGNAKAAAAVTEARAAIPNMPSAPPSVAAATLRASAPEGAAGRDARAVAATYEAIAASTAPAPDRAAALAYTQAAHAHLAAGGPVGEHLAAATRHIASDPIGTFRNELGDLGRAVGGAREAVVGGAAAFGAAAVRAPGAAADAFRAAPGFAASMAASAAAAAPGVAANVAMQARSALATGAAQVGLGVLHAPAAVGQAALAGVRALPGAFSLAGRAAVGLHHFHMGMTRNGQNYWRHHQYAAQERPQAPSLRL